MDWIDETVAIGSWMDAYCVRKLRREKIDLIIDSRTLFFRKFGTSRNEPRIDLVEKAAEMMIELSGIKVKVLVFCNHGKDRSPFLVMVYFCKKNGISCDEAYQLIKGKRKRTIYHPEWVKILHP
jgi:Dual specificity phosphatase, catalytic domain